LDQPARFTAAGDHFLLRFASKTSFHPDPQRPAQAGLDPAGRRFTQAWGWMGAATDRRRRYVRQITLERPGEEAVVVVTDLLDETAYPAVDLLAVYLARWQIESVFQAITEVFSLRHLIGSAPRATVFQASLCLVIYNVLQVLRGYAAQAAPTPTPVDAVSAEQLFADLHEELLGLHRVLDAEELRAGLPTATSAEQTQARLRVLLTRAWSARWLKAVNKKRRPHRPPTKQSGAHTSVHKILEAAKAANGKKHEASTSSG